MGRLAALVLLCLGPGNAAAQSQPPIRILNPTNPSPIPSDARMTQFDVETKGAICLQSEGAEVHFRNIKLRTLE